MPVSAAPEMTSIRSKREVGPLQALVRCVRLDEGKPPGRQRCSDDAGDDDQRSAGVRDLRGDQPAAGLGPVRMRQEGRADVRDEHRREQQQHMLDAVETATQDDESDQHRGRRDGEIPADPRELEARRDARKLGAGRAQVRDHERRDCRCRRARAVRGANERDQPLSGDEPESRAELVVDDQRRDREQQDPEQRVAVAGAGDRVRRDSGRVVIREPGEQAGAEHREQCRQSQPSKPRAERRAAVPPPELPGDRVEHCRSSLRLGAAGSARAAGGKAFFARRQVLSVSSVVGHARDQWPARCADFGQRRESS